MNNIKYIAFRVDGGADIGIAHVMRCLTIANYLKNRKINSIFFIKIFNEYIYEMLSSKFNTVIISDDNEVLDIAIKYNITDFVFDISHMYTLLDLGIIKKIIETLKIHHIKTIVFDGLIEDDSIHQNIYTRSDYIVIPYLNVDRKCYKINRYNSLLIGLDYFILKEDIINVVNKKYKKDNQILITFGGSDPKNNTSKVLKCIIKENLKIKVLITPSFDLDNIEMIHEAGKKNKGIEIINNLTNVYKLIAQSELLITSTGLTKYEQTPLKTPSIIISNDERMKFIHENLEDYGITYFGVLNEKCNSFLNLISEILKKNKQIHSYYNMNGLMNFYNLIVGI